MATPPTMLVQVHLHVNAPPNVSFYRHAVTGDGKCLLHAIAFLMADQIESAGAGGTAVDQLLHRMIDYLTFERWQRHIMPQFMFDIVERMRSALADTLSDADLDTVFADMPIEARTFNASIAQHFCTFDIPTDIIVRYLERTERQMYDAYMHHLRHERITTLSAHEMQCIAALLSVNILAFDSGGRPFADNVVCAAWPATICLFNAREHWEPIVACFRVGMSDEHPQYYYRSISTRGLCNWGTIEFTQ